MREECLNKKENLKKCNCTYEPCERKGICCLCLKYHLAREELPACFFPTSIEKTYDTSIKKFCEINIKKT